VFLERANNKSTIGTKSVISDRILTDYQKETVEKLDILAQKIDTLTAVVAISSHVQTLLKDKVKKDQIRILFELGLSREIIALMVGTTPETVSVRISEMKAEKKKVESNGQEVVKKDEREAV
jgi:CRP-like cAMP-binding protein